MLMEMGKGTFGTIYLTYNLREKIEVATKIEPKKHYKTFPQLKMEYLVLKSLLGLNVIANQAKSLGQDVPAPDFSGAKKIPHAGIYLLFL